ncbi:hypothetical protein XpopCFBP1817_14390 [Xanthomonas populi]|uniref:Uncharacterized protein n=1 Tax=Xanthomonas populi TaxID=53414 RepID=A0A2S7ELY6_9XANT|nr:hypothetical protein XpopCFBP1817_14390 [Xanthomonas populi]
MPNIWPTPLSFPPDSKPGRYSGRGEVTPAQISKVYFEGLSAPTKEFLLLPRTGHDPNPPMLDAQLKVLTRIRASALANDTH